MANCEDLGAIVHACNVKYESRGIMDVLEKSTRVGRQGTQHDAIALLQAMEKQMWRLNSRTAPGVAGHSQIDMSVGGSNYKLIFSDEGGNVELTRISH